MLFCGSTNPKAIEDYSLADTATQTTTEVHTTMRNRASRGLLAFFAMLALFVGFTASASAGTRVGPTLTQSTAKAETQTMLTSDRGVQAFLGLSVEAAVNIKVTDAKRFKCHIGYDDRCPFNTYKDGWKVKQTDYRRGKWRWSYRVTFTYHGETRKVTFHELSSNLLSGAKRLKKPGHARDTAADITMRMVVKVQASVSAEACGFKVTASAKAQLQTLTFKVKSSHAGWSTINNTLKAAASATGSVKQTKCDTGTGGGSPSCVGPTNTSASNSGVPCQAASQGASGTATVTTTPTCQGNTQNSCNTTTNIYITNTQTIYQFNCSKVTIVYSDGTSTETWFAKDGSVTTEQICSSQTNECSQASDSQQCNENPTPVCPDGTVGTYPDCKVPSCPPGTVGTPPNCSTPHCPSGTTGTYPDCKTPQCPSGTVGTYPNCKTPCPPGTIGMYKPDCKVPAPLVEIIGSAHETFVNGIVYFYAKMKLAPNHDGTLGFSASGGGVISNKTTSDMYDTTPCPDGWKCFKARYDAPPYPVVDPNQVTITATVKQDDNQLATDSVNLNVIPDDFGTKKFQAADSLRS